MVDVDLPWLGLTRDLLELSVAVKFVQLEGFALLVFFGETISF